MTRTTVIDRDDSNADFQVTVHCYPTNWHTLAEDVGQRVISTLQNNPFGYYYFNPAVTVFSPSPLPKFFQIVRSEQARWCRHTSKTFSRQARRRSSRWISGGLWVNNKYARYMDRALCFTGVLFNNGVLQLPHQWPKGRSGDIHQLHE